MISVSQLTKTFTLTKEAQKQLAHGKQDPRHSGNQFHALNNVNFSCPTGEVLGLLGANGAGKTTTLRILASALKPDSGSIIIDDQDVIANPLLAKKKIGFLSGKTGLYARLTAKENIEYFAKLHGVKDQQLAQYSEQVYQELGIEPYLYRRVETLSTGMQQKVSIARAVIHQPEVLVLDEPTTGLDIMATETMLEFISSMKHQGKSVIFSTHHLDEVAFLADRLAIIEQGTSCFNGTIAEFQNATGEQDLRKAFMSVLAGNKLKETS